VPYGTKSVHALIIKPDEVLQNTVQRHRH